MSYVPVLSLRALGSGASFSASSKVAADVKSGAAVTTTVQDAAKAADVELPDCSAAAVTGNSYIDSTFVKCCQDIKKMSGMTLKQKADGIGQCAARGAATGACMAAGVVTFGVTTALAPLCGTIGAAVYDRVSGYDTKQWVAAGVGAAVCSAVSAGVAGPICAFAAAELVGWIADELGPLFDSIFSPNAARDRELAARKAFHALVAQNEKMKAEADQAVRDLWSNSIKSIKEAYNGSLALLPAAYRSKAQQALGFAPLYDGIAGALRAAGAPITPLTWPVDASSTVGDRLLAQRARAGYGCEGTAEGCIKDGYSEICPFSFSDLYMTAYYSQGMDKLTGNTRDKQVAFEKYALSMMQGMAGWILPRMQQAIAVVASKVATVMAGLKQQSLLEAAKAKDDAKIVATAWSAAKAAEKAASDASSWSGSRREKALAQAERKYEVVVRASGLLTFAAAPGAPAPSAAHRSKMADAVQRAGAAVKLAKSNARTAQLTLGAGVAIGVAGIGYVLLRRS